MRADTKESWAILFAECARDIPELRADELDDELLIDYDLDDCIEQIDGQESMQGPSEEEGSRSRTSDPWWKTTEGEHMALYIPRNASSALRQECIEWVHVHPFSGHVGRDRTTELLQRDFWWPSLQEDTAKYVQDCEMCSTSKPLNRKKTGLLSPLPIPGRPWESIGKDFITHLPQPKAGYTAVYVVVDRLTKLVHIAPTTDTATAADTAQLFLDMVFKNHDLPSSTVSDRDVNFRSSSWTAFCQQVGIKLKCLHDTIQKQMDIQNK